MTPPSCHHSVRPTHPIHDGPSSAALRPKSTHPADFSQTGPTAVAIRPQSDQLRRGRSDAALAEQARAQHGVLTTAQIGELGLSPRAVRHRAASGRLTRVHTGVFAVAPPCDRGRWMAAVLACGSGATLSHRSAAALWGIARDGGRIDVTVAGRAGRTRTGISVHRGESLSATDVTAHERIPCTTLARTLLDLAAVLDRRSMERAVERAEELRVFDLDALRELLRRHRRRHGRRILTTILAEYDGPSTTRSHSEERMLALLAWAGLPRPRVNAWIALADNTGYEADFLWPDARLVVEVDGRMHHARRRAFAHDRQRDRQLALAGYETRRYAAAELTDRPERVVAELRSFLSPSR